MVDDFSDRSSTIEKFVKEIFVLDAPPIRSMKQKKKGETRNGQEGKFVRRRKAWNVK